MSQENFLINPSRNPPKRLSGRKKISGHKRRRNPIGEILTVIGANPSRRNPMASNPWYGNSAGHRRAALIRWGKLPRKKRKVSTRKIRRVVHKKRGRWTPAHVRLQKKLAKQSFWADKYGEMLAHPRRKVYKYKTRGVAYYMKKHKRRSSNRRRKNTWFGQPRRHKKAAKKGWRIGHLLSVGKRRRRVRHWNPIGAVSANPRRSRRHYNVKHRRRHRNPFGLGSGAVKQFTGTIMDVRHWAPLAITGGLSAITGAVVPGMLGVSNSWAKYGVQVGVAVGGGIVVEKAIGKEHGQAWMVVGMAMVGYQLLKEFVLQPYFPQFAVGLGEYADYYPTSDDNAREEISQQVGAFPNQMSAFPSSINDYPGVGGYPYDGAGY